MKIVTHNGDFHSDELLAVAALRIHYGREQCDIVRTRDPEVVTSGDVVVDVGYVYDPETKRFDHHQKEGAGAHNNGIPYSSFGLVWKHYGEAICGDAESARIIKEKIAYPIDAADNGISVFAQIRSDVFPYIFHSVIASLRPTWKEIEEGTRTHDAGFFEALEITEQILRREILVAQHMHEGAERIRAAHARSSDKHILLLDGHYPMEAVAHEYPEVLFVVKPDKQNAHLWKVKTVRNNAHTFINRKDLPLAWAGKTNEALQAVTGVADAVFCHVTRFIAIARSQEGALALARMAVDEPLEHVEELIVENNSAVEISA